MSKPSGKNKESAAPVAEKSTKLRPKVPCYCKKCNSKLIETRTRQKHEIEENQLQTSISSMKKNKEKETSSSTHTLESRNSSKSSSDDYYQLPYDEDITMIDRNNNQSDEEFFIKKSADVRKKRKRYNQFYKTDDTIIILIEDTEQRSESSDEEGSQTSDDELDFDKLILDDDELFAAPGSNLNFDPDKEKNIDINDPWILIWIFKYQERFKLSNVAINSLIGFFSLILKNINTNQFKDFPSTVFMARKALAIRKKPKLFAACVDCDKLYDPTEIIPQSNDNTNTGFKCTHIEFQIIRCRIDVNLVDQNCS